MSFAPLYLPTIKRVNAALAKAGTIEAATCRFGIQSAWHSGGRSSESACITWDTALQWDEEMQEVYVEVKQSKISKAKLIAFVAAGPIATATGSSHWQTSWPCTHHRSTTRTSRRG